MVGGGGGVLRFYENVILSTANDDAEEAHDTLGYQVRFTDALQTKIDELHALASQVDPVAADAIKNRANQ